MIECNECDGKGGWVCVDPYSVGCDETGEIEGCHKCHGDGTVSCEFCDEPATVETVETISVPITSGYAGAGKTRRYKTYYCEKCFEGVENVTAA